MVYNFADIEPASDLRWTPCYDNFTCARLEAPLDYTNAALGTVTIAYIRKHAISKAVNGADGPLFLTPEASTTAVHR